MAYLDDNHNDLFPKGDPLEEFDRELADLRSALEALEPDAPAAQDKPSAPDTEPTAKPAPSNADKAGGEQTDTVPAAQTEAAAPASGQPSPNAATSEKDGKETHTKRRHAPKAQTEESARKNAGGSESPKKKKKRSPLAIILITLLLLIVIVVGAGFAFIHFTPKDSFLYRTASGFYHLFAPSKQAEEVANGDTIVISDSVMGDIELDTVEGAQLNTLDNNNFVTDDNGIPAYYENNTKISHLGADLSEFQGNVDFAAMKAAGVEFVMLRVGGRSYGDEGSLYADGAFSSNYEQAKAAGLKVGAYFFSQATTAAEAKEEATFALAQLDGRTLDYPIAFDWENIADDSARTDYVTGDQLTSIAEAFCDTINAGGYQSIVYSNTQQMFVLYDFETMKNYRFWLADYRDRPNMYYKFDMWQYTKDGTIDGVDGTVDLNLSFTDFSE